MVGLETLGLRYRCGSSPASAGNPFGRKSWVHFGAIFWNTGIALGLVAIAFGEGTSIPLLGMPRYVQPILLAAYSAIAVSGILSWTGRTRQISYAAQWYAAAPLFLFPWFFSLVQVMLFWHPARGVVQSVVSSWYSQAAWTLWIAPAALSGAYYILPKLTGKTVRAYEFAALGFWSLLFIGAWTGGRHLIGGPVPAWISALAVVTSALFLLFHYLIVRDQSALRPRHRSHGGQVHRNRHPGLPWPLGNRGLGDLLSRGVAAFKSPVYLRRGVPSTWRKALRSSQHDSARRALFCDS